MSKRSNRASRAAASSSPSSKQILNSAWTKGFVLVAITVLVYLPVLHAGFIWDDNEHLTGNACIVGPLGFKDIWTASQSYYYPLVLTSFWILHQFVGLNPLPYHLFTVFMHAGSAVLLWRVLQRLDVKAAWLGAALWALHPVIVQSVAWITELKNTQSCLLYLLSILFFLKSRDVDATAHQRRWRFAISLLFFAMAITSKSATVMLPVVLGLCLWWQNGRISRRDFLQLLPFFLISVVASAWTIWEQKFHSGALGVEWSQTLPERFAIAGWDIWFYLGKLIWPSGLSFFYPQWKIDIGKLSTFLPLLGAIAGLFFLWYARNSRLRPLFVAAFYFVVSLFPVLSFFNVYFFRFSFVSDHFQYLAAMGPLALAASGIAEFGQSIAKEKSWLQSLLGGALLLIFGILSWRQANYYTDAETLYRMSIDRNPKSWVAYTNLGAVFLQKRQLEDAISYCQKALEIKPDAAETQYNLGNCFLAKGDFALAIGPYQTALRTEPGNVRTHNNLAACLAGIGRIEQALDEWREAIRVDPNFAESHFNLGYVLMQVGHRDEAAKQLIEAVRLKPDYAIAREKLRELGVPGF